MGVQKSSNEITSWQIPLVAHIFKNWFLAMSFQKIEKYKSSAHMVHRKHNRKPPTAVAGGKKAFLAIDANQTATKVSNESNTTLRHCTLYFLNTNGRQKTFHRMRCGFTQIHFEPNVLYSEADVWQWYWLSFLKRKFITQYIWRWRARLLKRLKGQINNPFLLEVNGIWAFNSTLFLWKFL